MSKAKFYKYFIESYLNHVLISKYIKVNLKWIKLI